MEADHLEPVIRRELRSLSKSTADLVARHLVTAGRLLDEDPVGSVEHARAARKLAGRLAVVRETVGVAEYRAGFYAEALADLRAARRISGSAAMLPLIADCERGLDRPERALKIAREADVARLDREDRVELSIVVSGARRDLGQPEAAALALHGSELDSVELAEWTPRLWYAYAEALLAADRVDEAREWFTATVTIDHDLQTDAEDRLRDLPEAGLDPQ